MSTWKKALSTLATASLLASLFTATAAAPVFAAGSIATSGGSSAVADGVDTVIIAIGGSVSSGDTLKIEVTGGATISAVSNTAWTLSADKTNVQWTNTGSNGSTAGNGYLALVSTKVGSFNVTLYTKPFGGTFAKTAEQAISFTGIVNTDLVTPTMIMTANSCPTTSGTTDVTTATSTAPTAYFGDAKVCAWVLLAENSGGTVNLDVTAGLSAWSWSIAPYGLLHNANGQPVTTVTKGADATTAVTVGGVTYLAVGKTVYANGSVGKTTVTWTGTYRGKAYTATDSLTFTGPATGIKLTGGDVSNAIANGYTLSWTATDANGIAVGASSGDMTAASSKAGVVAVTAINSVGTGGTVTYNCVTTGQTVITLATKTGVTPAFTSNGVTVTCGAGAAKTVSVVGSTVKVGGIATVTVTVKDKNGLPVVDGTVVNFATNGGIFIDADTFAIMMGSVTDGTDNGVATVALWAPSVPSTVTVLATTGGVAGTGTVSVTATGASASGITARVGTGAYASTTRVAKLGQTITWRANLGSAAANASVGVYQRVRNANGTWTTARRWATRTADANGVVTFSWKLSTSKWIQVRFVATGASTSYLGGVWR